MNKNGFMAATGMLALFAAAPVFAQTTTNVPVSVDLTLSSACLVNSGGTGTAIRFPNVVNPLAFVGNLDGSNLGADGGTPLSITCNSGPVIANFNISSGANDLAGEHRLANGSSFVKYKVYLLPSRASNTELKPSSFAAVSIDPNTPFSIDLYSRILQSDINLATGGPYSDFLSAKLTF